jgi:hypothetical protein
MCESIHLIWIDSRACEYSSRTQSSRGPACLHFASRIVTAILKSSISKVRCIRDKTLKNDDQKAYPEVAPCCPLSGSIRRVRSKSVVGPACGRRGGVIAPSDLTRVVHTDKVTEDIIDLPMMTCALKHGLLPWVARQTCTMISISMNNHCRMRI